MSKQRKVRHLILSTAVVLLVAFACLATSCELFTNTVTVQQIQQPQDYQLKVYMLDVGQGDSILLASGGQYMLIDAGENDKGDDVVADLKAIGVTKLAAVVGTHPHSDHIGGLDTVIKEIPVDTVYMPGKTANTETYEDVLDAVDAKGLHITIPKPGQTVKLGEAELEFLWPPVDYDSSNENNCSIVIRATAGGHSVLLMGDAETAAEKGILDLGETVSCDVLKVGHHGSDTSSKKAFLKAALPRVALISVGKDNDYHHPDKDTLKRLSDIGAVIHRTDLNGMITVTVAGGQLTVQDSK
jgi:competence protein ComEC